ncbi:MAG: DUF6483 family protein [Trueperaceae bacterium]
MPIRDELIERTVRQLSAMLARLFRSPTAEDATGVADVMRAEGITGEHPAGARLPDEAREEEVDRAREELRTLYRSHLGTTPELLHRLDAENLLDVLSSAGSVDGERAYVVAAMFSAEARVELAGGAEADDDLVLDLRERALDLMLEAALSGLGEADLPARIEALAGSVPAENRRPVTWERMHRYEHERGAYARAEDALFGWLDSLEPQNEPRNEPEIEPEIEPRIEAMTGAEIDTATAPTAPGPIGADRAGAAAASFYDDLDERTDEELRAGGLEREELAEGRADFSRRLHALGVHR